MGQGASRVELIEGADFHDGLMHVNVQKLAIGRSLSMFYCYLHQFFSILNFYRNHLRILLKCKFCISNKFPGVTDVASSWSAL